MSKPSLRISIHCNYLLLQKKMSKVLGQNSLVINGSINHHYVGSLRLAFPAAVSSSIYVNRSPCVIAKLAPPGYLFNSFFGDADRSLTFLTETESGPSVFDVSVWIGVSWLVCQSESNWLSSKSCLNWNASDACNPQEAAENGSEKMERHQMEPMCLTYFILFDSFHSGRYREPFHPN